MANANNFFEVGDKEITFWGLDILPKRILLTVNVEKIVKEFSFPSHEQLRFLMTMLFKTIKNRSKK